MIETAPAIRQYALTRDAARSLPKDSTRARRAGAGDLAFVADLHAAEFPATYATATHLVADPDRFTFIVERDGAPLGYASGHVGAEGVGYLDYMAVAPHARGLGDGSILLAATVRNLFAGSRVDELRLDVEEHRGPAIRFYEAHGFVRVLPEA